MTERKCFVFKFADVEVREREFLLIKAGGRIPVEPKAFRVLLYLLRNPGRLIPKDEIVGSVWIDSAVSDNSLTRSIAQLRRVLGDDSREPLYILTVPTVGYRFLCEVSAEEDGFGVTAATAFEPAQATQGELEEVGLAPPRELPVAADSAGAYLSVPVTITCLAVVLIGIAGLCLLRQRVDIINQIPMNNSSEVLAAKARDIAKSLGYAERPVDTSFGWSYNEDYLRFSGARGSFSANRVSFSAQRPPAVFFWVRESPHYLVDFAGIYAPKQFARDTLEPGMLQVLLDSEGRLMEFHALPRAEHSGTGQKPEFDWGRLFLAAGLDPSRFTRVQPTTHPQGTYDSQAAWIDSWETDQQYLLRVEAVAYLGQPIFFRIFGPWTRPDEHPSWSAGVFSFSTFLYFLVVLPIGAGLLAWRNARLGRADQRGALRLAGSMFLCMFLGSVAGNNHTPTFAEITTLFSALRDAFITGVIFWVLYMAAEPVVRRRSPATLVAWRRLLEGKLRDPRVGAEVLAGFVLGIVGTYIVDLVPIPFIEPLAPRLAPNLGAFFSLWCWFTIVAAGIGLSMAFVLNLLLQLVRNRWLAVSIFVIAMTIMFAAGGPPITVLRGFLLLLIDVYALMRFGVLAAVALSYVHNVVLGFPLTTNLSTWFAPAAMLAIGSVVALAVYAFWIALAGRRLWKISLESL